VVSCIAILGGNQMMSYVVTFVDGLPEKINPIEFERLKAFDRLG
jgi:hypothetical protein